MMNNLFSNFDPSTNFFKLNWMSMMLLFLILPSSMFKLPARSQMFIILLTKFMISNIINNLKKMNFNTIIILMSIFFIILFNNFLGLFPYIFTASSHLVFSMNLALPLWLSLMIYGWLNLMENMFSHLIPLGTPMMLSSFMVLIETISNLIRPLTLSVRLSANMISGHLLITLLSNIPVFNPTIYIIMSPLLIMLIFLEMAVAIIQSYVFTLLSSLYLNEIN